MYPGVIFLAAFLAVPPHLQRDSIPTPTDAQLWQSSVDQCLSRELWADSLRYDAGHGLMVPLHAAFALHRRGWQRAFAEHFRRSVRAQPDPTLTEDDELSWLLYLYLSSRFIVLAAEAGEYNLIPHGLSERLYGVVHREWRETPAWQWDKPPFKGGIRERLEWKLSVTQTERSYYRAVIDPEMYLFAIAADLRQYERLTGHPGRFSSDISELLTAARRVYDQRAEWQTGGGWLFQTGVWRDHPDYQFAGEASLTDRMRPWALLDVAEDVSHSDRQPLWLTSLRDAYPPGTEESAHYQQLLTGLSRQFFGRVVVGPSRGAEGYRTTNFMDGRNGVYGSKVTRGYLYGPYGLSGTLDYGWWAFLRSPESRALYHRLAAELPPELHDPSTHNQLLTLAIRLASHL